MSSPDCSSCEHPPDNCETITEHQSPQPDHANLAPQVMNVHFLQAQSLLKSAASPLKGHDALADAALFHKILLHSNTEDLVMVVKQDVGREPSEQKKRGGKGQPVKTGISVQVQLSAESRSFVACC